MNKFAKLFLLISMVSAVNAVATKTDYKAKAYSCFRTVMTFPFERIKVTSKDDKGSPIETSKDTDGKPVYQKEQLSGARLWALSVTSRAALIAGIAAAAVYIKNNCKCTSEKAKEATN